MPGCTLRPTLPLSGTVRSPALAGRSLHRRIGAAQIGLEILQRKQENPRWLKRFRMRFAGVNMKRKILEVVSVAIILLAATIAAQPQELKRAKPSSGPAVSTRQEPPSAAVTPTTPGNALDAGAATKA